MLALLSVATGSEAVVAAKEVARMIASMIKRSPVVMALVVAVGQLAAHSLAKGHGRSCGMCVGYTPVDSLTTHRSRR